MSGTAWADCKDRKSEIWKHINRCQDGQIARSERLEPWGWRGRALRLRTLVRCLQLGPSGFSLWRRALSAGSRIPREKAKAFKTPLATAAGIAPGDIPADVGANEFHGWVWQILDDGDLPDSVQRLETALA